MLCKTCRLNEAVRGARCCRGCIKAGQRRAMRNKSAAIRKAEAADKAAQERGFDNLAHWLLGGPGKGM